VDGQPEKLAALKSKNMKEYQGTLRITNPKTLQYWKDTGKFNKLINEGYIYCIGCGRFRMEICTCFKCRKAVTT